ncbi:MAG: hypothetical protein ABR552_09860, partial [Actinomycetota bacterium]
MSSRKTFIASVIAAIGIVTTALPAWAATSVADLSVSALSGSPAVVAPPGGIVQYTVVVTNNGPAAAPNAALTDTSTGGGSYVSTSSSLPSGCAVTDADGNAGGQGTVNPVITCTFSLLQPGAANAKTIVVGIKTSTTPGTESNTATASIPPNPLGVLDGTPDNNTRRVDTPVEPQADLGISVAQSGSSVITGSTITYTVTASNYGPSDSRAFVSDSSTGGGTFSASGSTIPAECTAPSDGTVDPTIT